MNHFRAISLEIAPKCTFTSNLHMSDELLAQGCLSKSLAMSMPLRFNQATQFCSALFLAHSTQ